MKVREETCTLCERKDIYWKFIKLMDKSPICSECYDTVTEKGKYHDRTIKEYQEVKKQRNKDRDIRRKYILTLKRYSVYKNEFPSLLKDFKIIEEETSEEVYKKERQFLTVREEQELQKEILDTIVYCEISMKRLNKILLTQQQLNIVY